MKRGFRVEVPKEHPTFKTKEVPCSLYRIKVSEETYWRTKDILKIYAEHPKRFRYSPIGLAFSIMQIVYKRADHYFCSQFVSEIMERAGVVRLEKHSTLYHPDDFCMMRDLEYCFTGTMRELIDIAMIPESQILA